MRSPLLTVSLAIVLWASSADAGPESVQQVVNDYKSAVRAQDHSKAQATLPLLAKFASQRAITPIFKSLDFLATREATYQSAVRALAPLPKGTGWSRVIRAVKHGSTVLESIFGLDILAARNLAGEDELVIDRLKDKDEAVRRRAILIMAERRRVAIVKALIEHMIKRDKRPDVEHQQCAVVLRELLGRSLPAGADYQSWWDGTVKTAEQLRAEQTPGRLKPWPGVVGSSRLNFRKRASLKGKPMRVLNPGKKFLAIGRNGKFWKVIVEIDGVKFEGYLSAAYVTVTNPSDNSKTGPLNREEGTTFYDVPLYGKSIIFLIDASKSMLSSGLSKGAIRELNKAIGLLPKKTRFNIIAFSNKTRIWKPEPELAKDDEKQSAQLWAKVIKFGSVTRLDLAFAAAFKMKGVDHIVLLTDGYPVSARNKRIPSSKIYRQLSELNRVKQVRISCFGFSAADHSLLKSLAARTGGRYQRIGK